MKVPRHVHIIWLLCWCMVVTLSRLDWLPCTMTAIKACLCTVYAIHLCLEASSDRKVALWCMFQYFSKDMPWTILIHWKYLMVYLYQKLTSYTKINHSHSLWYQCIIEQLNIYHLHTISYYKLFQYCLLCHTHILLRYYILHLTL